MNNTINTEKYLRDRVDNQINWYSTMSKWNQKMYKLIKTVEVTFAALIPFLVSFISSNAGYLKVIVGALGISISVISGILALYRFQENWIEFRKTAESLKREKFLYIAKVDIYSINNPYPLFVQRVEGLIAKENTRWLHNMTTKEKDSKNNPKESDSGLNQPNLSSK